MSAIPTKAREVIAARSHGRCERCGGRASEVHHRQRRREAGHGIPVLVHLCSTCHRYVHAHPLEARNEGFIVSFALDPTVVPLRHISLGWVVPTEDGGWVSPEKGAGSVE